jgi:hypothetical protein
MEEVGFATDSALEETGFEPPAPPLRETAFQSLSGSELSLVVA